MIASDEYLKKICRNYHLVENYMQARFDKENKWELHHRREKDEIKSRQQLIDEGRYYDVEPEELIFLTRDEHNKLHHKDKFGSEETRKKMSESHQDITGENHPMFGKHHSEEAKLKVSLANKGRKASDETKKKISEVTAGENNPMFGKHHSEESKKKMSEAKKGDKHPQFGFHWWNNGNISIKSKDCPGEGFVLGRLIKWKCR